MHQTAAELWGEWVRSGTVRPQDYDADVELRVRAVLERAGTATTGLALGAAMDAAGWAPRDLVRSLAPLVSSFAGMMRDLLQLLSRVSATSGTGENLRVIYEFDEREAIDQSLAGFRELTERVESVVVRLRPIVFDPSQAWQSPLRDHRSQEAMRALTARVDAAGRQRGPLPADIPTPSPTGVPRVDDLLTRYLELIHYVTGQLADLDDDPLAVVDELRLEPQTEDSGDSGPDASVIAMAEAATDHWALHNAASIHGFADAVRERRAEPTSKLLDALDAWLRGFWGAKQEVSQDVLVREFADVLSLPTWGRRHELYAAWIATQIDRALGSARLKFIVTDGALRFPFRATLLARLDPPHGEIQLWCEVRSPASDLSGGGRKAAVQPDYRFVRASDDTAVAVVEVKQYLRSATRNAAAALRDYVIALPDAEVLLVAHGPVGAKVLEAVPPAQRHRARVHRDVRVGSPRQTSNFRADVAGIFPAPPPPPAVPASPPHAGPLAAGDAGARPIRIQLSWEPGVHDLDLHVRGDHEKTSWSVKSTAHSTLREDAFDGGPEIVDLRLTSSVPLDVHVHVFGRGR